MPKIAPRLQRRGGKYYIRAKVPADLRHILGKREYHYSLKTTDLSEARQRVHLESLKIDSAIAAARRRKEARPVTVLSQAEGEYIALEWFATMEAARAEAVEPGGPLNGLDDDEVRDARNEAEYWVHAFSNSDHPDGATTVESTLRTILRQHGIEIDPRSERFWSLHEVFRRGHLELARRDLQMVLNDYSRAAGDQLFDRIRGPAPMPPVPPLTLEQLIERYEGDPSRMKLAIKSRLKQNGWHRVFKEAIGADRQVSEITVADASALLELLATLPPNSTKLFPGLTVDAAAAEGTRRGLPPMSPASAKGYFTAFSALMRFAVDRGYRSDNPAERLRVRPDPVPARRKKHPFTTDQLELIFNAPLYRGCKNDGLGYNRPGPHVIRRGRFWVPVVALYTGMRLGEICQLEVADLVSLDGVDVILVRGDDDDETKRVKTEAGNRYVPVHPDLMAFGLLEHKAGMAAAGERRLFPELTRANTGNLSDNFSKWFSDFLEAIGAKTKRTSFHSFRHTYRDALREADISRERVQALGGWSSRGTDAIYGDGPRASTLAREIEKVRFPGVDLSHLTARL